MFEVFGGPRWVSDDHTRPREYDHLVRQGLTGVVIYPWALLSVDEVVAETSTLHRTEPDQKLVAFARRFDSGQLACWDAQTPRGHVVSVLPADSVSQVGTQVEPGRSISHASMWGWLRDVAEVFIQLASAGGHIPAQQSEEGSLPGLVRVEGSVARLSDKSYHWFSTPQAPAWLRQMAFDPGFRVLRCGMVAGYDWYPWRFLPDVDLVVRTETMHQVYPDRQFVVFAHNLQDDVLACWDSAQSDGTVYLIHHWYSAEPTRRITTCPDVLQWFRHVVIEDFIAEGKRRVNLLRVED